MNSRFDAPDSVTILEFPYFPDAQTRLARGRASEFATMRAAQLTALLQLLCAEAAEQCEETARQTALWLAASFAREIAEILPVALREASKPPPR